MRFSTIAALSTAVLASSTLALPNPQAPVNKTPHHPLTQQQLQQQQLQQQQQQQNARVATAFGDINTSVQDANNAQIANNGYKSSMSADTRLSAQAIQDLQKGGSGGVNGAFQALQNGANDYRTAQKDHSDYLNDQRTSATYRQDAVNALTPHPHHKNSDHHSKKPVAGKSPLPPHHDAHPVHQTVRRELAIDAIAEFIARRGLDVDDVAVGILARSGGF